MNSSPARPWKTRARRSRTGAIEAALGSLEQFRPPHDLVTRALTELRAEAERIERERAEATRREAEAARRQRELGAVTAQIEDFIRRLELDAADLALSTAERRLEYPADLRSLRERVDALRAEAQRDQLAREPWRTPAGAERTTRRSANDAARELRTKARIDELARPPVERHRLRARHRRGPRRSEPILEPAQAVPGSYAVRQAPLAAGPPLITSPNALHGSVPAGSDRGRGLLALIVGTWLAGVWPGRSPRGPRDLRQPPDQVTERPTPAPAAPSPVDGRSVENASVSSPDGEPCSGNAPDRNRGADA